MTRLGGLPPLCSLLGPGKGSSAGCLRAQVTYIGTEDGHLVVDVSVVLSLLLVDVDGGDEDGREGDVKAGAAGASGQGQAPSRACR